jgi:hypothetical protein
MEPPTTALLRGPCFSSGPGVGSDRMGSPPSRPLTFRCHPHLDVPGIGAKALRLG